VPQVTAKGLGTQDGAGGGAAAAFFLFFFFPWCFFFLWPALAMCADIPRATPNELVRSCRREPQPNIERTRSSKSRESTLSLLGARRRGWEFVAMPCFMCVVGTHPKFQHMLKSRDRNLAYDMARRHQVDSHTSCTAE
jgi:hypothetical protein